MTSFQSLPPTAENLRLCLSLMDLTTLRPQDTVASVTAFVGKVNRFPELFPDCPLPASICVYPNFAATVRDALRVDGVGVTTVAGGFPSSQTFPEVKALEIKMALDNGADEVDIVLALNAFLDGNDPAAAREIRTARELLGPQRTLKVILETGLLDTPDAMYKASVLAMQNGADFVKTSTGKVAVGATPEAAEILCRSIREHYLRTGEKVGFKAAGGISKAEDALLYAGIVRDILGPDWIQPSRMRLGVSRLGNSLLSAVRGEEISYF